MTIICSMRALIYCAAQDTSSHALPISIDEDSHVRWIALQTLLKASQIPIYVASADAVHQEQFLDIPKLEIAASAHSKGHCHV